LCALAAGIYHPYLLGRDEPREAEIAREMLVDGHWIAPYLCGLPFLEKPPLYYGLVAAAYKLTGSISPPVARSVSALLAVVMLAAVFLLAYRWAGARSAWFSTLILLAMPQFFRYSHTIVLDIAVGAFCTVALLAFVCWAFWAPLSRKHGWLYLFYLASAGVFLSKGLIGVFHIVLIIGAFLLLRRRTALLKELLAPRPLLIFLVPVAVWIFLYYREGGAAYLHEHFVNNTIGRFLRIHFTFPGANFYHTDLGNKAPWHFYLSSLPRIVGVALAILFYRKAFTAAAFLSLAVALDAAIIYNSPNVLLHRDGCYLAFGRQVWAQVGEAPLFLYAPGEAIRGCIPFSRNRLAREINLPEQLRPVLSSKDRVFVLTRDNVYRFESTASALQDLDLHVAILDGNDHTSHIRQYALISNSKE
jgi:4-amino-4-deoxy-L-arabinose transferase-like glycosyltransferase